MGGLYCAATDGYRRVLTERTCVVAGPMVTVAPIMESLAACRTMLQSARTRVSASSTGGDSVDECRQAVDECKHGVETLRQRCHATSELLDKATAAQALAQVRSCAPCRHHTASANAVVHTHTHSASWRQSVMTLHALAPWCPWWALAATRLLLRPWTTRIKLFVASLRCEQQLLTPPLLCRFITPPPLVVVADGRPRGRRFT